MTRTSACPTIYHVTEHVGIVSDKAEYVHFFLIIGKKSFGIRGAVHRPCHDGQPSVESYKRIIDSADSGLLIGTAAYKVPGSVPKNLGNILRALEDIGRGNCDEVFQALGPKRPEGKWIEAGNKNPVLQMIGADQMKNLPAKVPVDLSGFDLKLYVVDKASGECGE